MLTLSEAMSQIPEVARHDREQRQHIQRLEVENRWLRSQVWGAKAESRALMPLNLGDQLWLGQELLDPPPEPPPSKKSVKAYEREHRKHPVKPEPTDSQLKFGDDVPVKVIEVDDPATAHIPAEQRELVSESVTYRLAQRSPYLVLKYVTKTWKDKGTGNIVTPPAPASVFPGSSVDVSFLAGLLVDKFVHHLPLYRQYERLVQATVFLSRGNLTRLVHRTAQLLEPIYQAVMSSVLFCPVLAVDESPTPAGVQKGAGKEKGKMHQGYFWVFYGSSDEIFYMFSPSRARSVLDAVLEGYRGTLLSDGYVAYESFAKGKKGILHAQCWTHSRRNFIKAEPVAPAQCDTVIKVIQQLYAVEREAELGSEELRQLRDKKSRPMVESLFTYLEKQVSESIFMPSNAFLKAAQYMLDRRKELEVFLDRPEVPLDTNHVERAIRPAVVGRKNWMFNFTETGARYAAIIYTLTQSCVLADINPTVYLTDVLQRIDTHPAIDVHLLTPRLWAKHFASNPLRSAATEAD
jgi:transposase